MKQIILYTIFLICFIIGCESKVTTIHGKIHSIDIIDDASGYSSCTIKTTDNNFITCYIFTDKIITLLTDCKNHNKSITARIKPFHYEYQLLSVSY